MMKKVYIPNTGKVKNNNVTVNVSKCTTYTNDESEVYITTDGVDYKVEFPYLIPVILQ